MIKYTTSRKYKRYKILPDSFVVSVHIPIQLTSCIKKKKKVKKCLNYNLRLIRSTNCQISNVDALAIGKNTIAIIPKIPILTQAHQLYKTKNFLQCCHYLCFLSKFRNVSHNLLELIYQLYLVFNSPFLTLQRVPMYKFLKIIDCFYMLKNSYSIE